MRKVLASPRLQKFSDFRNWLVKPHQSKDDHVSGRVSFLGDRVVALAPGVPPKTASVDLLVVDWGIGKGSELIKTNFISQKERGWKREALLSSVHLGNIQLDSSILVSSLAPHHYMLVVFRTWFPTANRAAITQPMVNQPNWEKSPLAWKVSGHVFHEKRRPKNHPPAATWVWVNGSVPNEPHKYGHVFLMNYI